MSEEKKRLRARCRDLRRGIPADVAAAAARNVAQRVTADIPVPPNAVIAGYWPFPDELDPRPLLTDLQARGHALCLPVVIDRGSSLLFRAWTSGEPLIEAVFGTRVPHADRPILVPDVLLVPLLAFDRTGYRLGYGGGYYDRTLAELEQTGAIAIGLAFAAQEVEKVPHEAHDWRLDWLVTETGAHRIA